MGAEVGTTFFSAEDRERFKARLVEETKLLVQWFKESSFESAPTKLGLELEGWLIDKNHLPLPKNKELIEKVNNEYVVNELSKYNFELNTDPVYAKGNPFSTLEKQVEASWEACQNKARDLNANILLTGILPMVRNEMLNLNYMSESNRYRALNDQLFYLRDNKPLEINIKGYDELSLSIDHIMIEAAATSLQVHYLLNPENAHRIFNYSIAASGPLVALSANSPFLYGKNLWSETRIPVFEQSIAVGGFRNKCGRWVNRVSFGSGYVKDSLLELFLENLNAFEVFIPFVEDSPVEKLKHLSFHNGTIWRWNRPIIGLANEKPHLRIEQRVMSAGPTIVDGIANIAFYVGLIKGLESTYDNVDELIDFESATENFYECAKLGLSAKVKWQGETGDVQQLLLNKLLPIAEKGLQELEIEISEIDYYLKDIIYHRILSGQNGSHWQRAYMDLNGFNFQKLSTELLKNQQTKKPVHTWDL